MKKRFLSILLSLCMLLMLCPVTAFADDEPTITISGAEQICAQQDYEFTVTASKGVTLDETFGHDTGRMGSDVELTIDEDGVGHGVVPAEWNDPDTVSFTLNAHGKTADGTPVSTTKHVEVSQDHIYEDGVCGCGAVLTYIVQYDGGAEFGLYADVKTYGKDLTLRGETFTRDGFIQTGWMDEYYNEYELGGDYTLDEDMTFYPVWEKLVTLTVPFTTTVALGDVGEPGETTFALALIDGWDDALTDDNVEITAAVTTDGAGDYAGTMTITGPEWTLWYMLSEGAFVRQVDAGEAGWVYDDAVWGLCMTQIAAYSMDDAAPGYAVLVVPAVVDEAGNYMIDWDSIDWENLQSEEMCFTNTYAAHVYELNNDADGHWDECDCGDIQNKEPHKYGDWKVTKEATETTVGEKEHTCTVCGYTEKAEIAKLPATDTTDSKKNNPNTGAATSPQTGDNSNLFLWIALLFVGGFGMIGTGMYSKRKRSSRKK